MTRPPQDDGNHPKRFYELFSEKTRVAQRQYVHTLGLIARNLVGRNDAADLTQEVMEALLRSSSLYPYITIGLAYVKARELAQAYWRPQDLVELTDELRDPVDDPFEAILKREAEWKAKEAYKASVQQIYTVVSSAQRDFLDSFIEMCSDLNIGQFQDENGVYSGEVRTLTGSLSVRIATTDLNGIEYIASVPGTEIQVGVGWDRIDLKTGTKYVWLRLDSQDLPAPAYCSLLRQPDGSYKLVWHRPNLQADGPYREGLKCPQFHNKNIAKHRSTSVRRAENTGDAIRRRLRRRPQIAEPIEKHLRARRISTSTIAASGLSSPEAATRPGPCPRTSEQGP